MIILGIDPGTATTGFGVIKRLPNNNLEYINCGVISTPAGMPDGKRLQIVSQEMKKRFKKYQPDLISVERIVFFKNAKTVITVSQSRGVVILEASIAKVPLFEFTPLQAKMAITGYGKANKKQIQKMVQMILGLESIPRPDDAADALGLAICCANSYKFAKLTKKS